MKLRRILLHRNFITSGGTAAEEILSSPQIIFGFAFCQDVVKIFPHLINCLGFLGQFLNQLSC